MDGGTFYSRGGSRSDSSSLPPSYHFSAGPSTSPWVPDHAHCPPSLLPETSVNQKLDRVLMLLETHNQEIECIRADTSSLKSEVEQLKQRGLESNSSVDTPPSTKKLPTELSVSKS